jgi:hypothetical protein
MPKFPGTNSGVFSPQTEVDGIVGDAGALAALQSALGGGLTTPLDITRVGGLAPMPPLRRMILYIEKSGVVTALSPAVAGIDLPADATSLIYNDLVGIDSFGDSEGGYGPTSDILEALGFPVLTTVGRDFFPYNNAALASIDLPVLTTVGRDFFPYTNAALASIDLPVLTTVGRDFSPSNNAALASIDLPVGVLKAIARNVNVSGCALTEAAVDAILVRIASLDGTNGTTTFDNKTVDLSGGTSAPPSVTGLAAKATLEGRGNTVTVNS